MKAVSLILALAVITGCNARAVPQADAPPSQWEETVDRFWQYISNLNQQADGALDQLKDSQISRELDTLITDTMAELATYRENIQASLPPYIQPEDLTKELQGLAERLQKDMVDAKDRSTKYLGDLKAMMGQNADSVRSNINTWSHKLEKRLNKDTEAIRNTVATYLGEVQSRTSQDLEAVRRAVEPSIQQASETANERLSNISTMLKTAAGDLGQQLETQAEGIKTQLEATAQDLRTSLEGKIDELTDLLSPYTSKIREQVESIMEKVKETTTA